MGVFWFCFFFLFLKSDENILMLSVKRLEKPQVSIRLLSERFEHIRTMLGLLLGFTF